MHQVGQLCLDWTLSVASCSVTVKSVRCVNQSQVIWDKITHTIPYHISQNAGIAHYKDLVRLKTRVEATQRNLQRIKLMIDALG